MKLRYKLAAGLLTIAVALFLVSKFIVSPYLVVGESMTPTLQNMDLCVMRKTWRYQPARGDVVVFRTADDPPLHFVKRVIGLPGETIRIRNGVVFVNDQPLPEPYTSTNPNWEMPVTPIPAGKVYVIGDNRTVGLDETVQGLVASRLVRARLMAHWRWKR